MRTTPARSGYPSIPPNRPGSGSGKTLGRWFASWRRLEVPGTAPEDEQWELLHVDENEDRRGSLVYREIQPSR